MDLILLEPGDTDILGGSLIEEKEWAEDNLTYRKSCIELVSINQGMKQQLTTDVSNSARTSGRPIITEFTCVKYVDKASVKLYEYCLRAQPIGKGKQATKIYVIRNSGDKMANIMTISLKDALVSEIQFQTHPNDMPTEQFKLSFTEVLWEYTVQNNDMTRSGNLKAGWSLSCNRPIGQFTSGM
jgi:type VI secretion system secreted protein Hcp